MPGVFERSDLRVRLVASRRAKEHVVIGFGIERWIEIDEIDCLVANVVAQNLEIVAEIESVSSHGIRRILARPTSVIEGRSASGTFLKKWRGPLEPRHFGKHYCPGVGSRVPPPSVLRFRVRPDLRSLRRLYPHASTNELSGPNSGSAFMPATAAAALASDASSASLRELIRCVRLLSKSSSCSRAVNDGPIAASNCSTVIPPNDLSDARVFQALRIRFSFSSLSFGEPAMVKSPFSRASARAMSRRGVACPFPSVPLVRGS